MGFDQDKGRQNSSEKRLGETSRVQENRSPRLNCDDFHTDIGS